MCYSNSNTAPLQAFKDRYKKELGKDKVYQPVFFASAFSFPLWPIVTNHSEMQFMQWGLLPNWLRQDPAKFAINTLNAKVETLTEKPSFKHLVSSNRCLIPSTGFFEHQTKGKEKIPYFIQVNNTPIFSFAGLFDQWVNPLTGQKSTTFTMITTAANDLMAEIHNEKKRMPAILLPEQEKQWLNGESLAMIQPLPNRLLSAHTIDKKFWNSNDERILAPYTYPAQFEQGTLF